MNKILVFDSGPLISLALNGLLHTLEELKKRFPGVALVITPSVKRETIDKAMSVKKYELEAVKLQTLLDSKVLTMSSEFVQNNVLDRETKRILSVTNSTFKADGKFLSIVQEGEASCLAFTNLCNCDSLIVIDERVTRLFTESPENLKAIMERKLHMQIFVVSKNFKEFKKFRFIRSTELVYFAYKNNLYSYKKDKNTLDALLYALKYSGTSISSKEIDEIKNL